MEFLQLFIGLAFFVGFYILFPLWASNEAKKKGLTKISKIAKISIFFLMGGIGGLVAWIASANRPYVSGEQKIHRQKTWLDNLKDSGLMVLVGIIATLIGYTMWQAIKGGTQGALIIGFIPLPLEILPIFALGAGIVIGSFGIGKSIITLFRVLIRGDKTYKYPKG